MSTNTPLTGKAHRSGKDTTHGRLREGWDGVEAHYRRKLEKLDGTPEAPRIIFKLLQVLMIRKQFDEALAIGRKAIKAYPPKIPGMPSVFYFTAKIYEAKSKATVSAYMRIAARHHGSEDDENVKQMAEAYLKAEKKD